MSFFLQKEVSDRGSLSLFFHCSHEKPKQYDEKILSITWIKGFKVPNRMGKEMEVYQLLYVDDTVVFCEAKAEQISFIRVILVVFEVFSGLRGSTGEKVVLSSSR